MLHGHAHDQANSARISRLLSQLAFAGDPCAVSVGLPLPAYLFGVCRRGGDSARSGARRLDGAAAAIALPPVCAKRLRSRTTAKPNRPLRARQRHCAAPSRPITIEERRIGSGACSYPITAYNDRIDPLAEIRNPNAPTQGSGGGSGTDMRSMLAFMVLAGVALLAFQYFKPPTPATPAQQQSQTARPVPQAAPGSPATTA